MAKFAIGDTVFVNSPYNVAEKCIVDNLNPYLSENIAYYVKSIDNFGSFYTNEDTMFETKDKALDAYKRKCDELVESYKEDIKDLKTLLEFPLRHCFCEGEYTEYEAKEAYVLKVKELTGIDLKEQI